MSTSETSNDDEDSMKRRGFLRIIPLSAGLTLLSAIDPPTAFSATDLRSDVNRIAPVDTDVRIDSYRPMRGTEVVGEKVIAGGDKHFYESPDGVFSVGIWEGEPGVARLDDYPVHEYWYLLSGEISFTNTAGETQRFKAGDTFVIPKGFNGTATIHSKLRKNFVSFHASAT